MLIKNKKGFTLIELIVVIGIFALIANVALVSLSKAKRESRDTKRLSDIAQLRSALHLYSIENLSYPIGNGEALGTGTNLVLDTTGWTDTPISPIFMYSVPRDSRMITQTPSACTADSNDVCDYGYYLYPDGTDYVIYFYLEGNVGSKSAGLHWASKDDLQ